ncbi:type VII secretion protein EccB [Streptomyces sp. NPDC059506]|uniref:type VII secretion protein EccB n=1 Tax=Streptomyces sp. NPDC059506 TaxID=3347751 RepID=UPI0036B52937
MATRRDELNAYTFARRRTVAAFLQPSPHGSEEGAPRPLKAVMPSLVVGTLVLVGFGAWGMIKPGAPKGWDTPNAKVIVGSESTTRYVVLKSGKGKKQLHPVLNLASAKLLLDPSKFDVIKVNESELDKSGIKVGATIGIPYAPDRLPDAKDAETRKYWALCEQMGGEGRQKSQKALFVLNEKDSKLVVKNKNSLTDREALFVKGPDGAEYLVDSKGTAHRLGRDQSSKFMNLLRRVVFEEGAQPQSVSAKWLSTLNPGLPIDFPPVDGANETSNAPNLAPEYAKVGLVLEAPSGSKTHKYVVLKDRVAPVSDFTAQLLLGSPQTEDLYSGQVPRPVKVAAQDITPGEPFRDDVDWPEPAVVQANNVTKEDGRKVSCSVYHGENNSLTKRPLMSVWAGRDYPEDVVQSGNSTYVSPGSGLLFRQVTGSDPNVGLVFLVTDTGLRYSVPNNGDSKAGGAGKADDKTREAQVRLGYEKTRLVPVPKVWSELLSRGPKLDTDSAKQPQNS